MSLDSEVLPLYLVPDDLSSRAEPEVAWPGVGTRLRHLPSILAEKHDRVDSASLTLEVAGEPLVDDEGGRDLGSRDERDPDRR